MRGIVLAGGTGTRLHPVTIATSKQLLPVYDKPMIYYPISVLMLAGITEILVITTPHDAESFRRVLGDGGQWGISIQYAVQPEPKGLVQAFLIGEEFLGGGPACLILGDNIFYGMGLPQMLQQARDRVAAGGAVVFGYQVKDPERYGVVEFGADGAVLSLEEKPANPRSSYAVTGIYFYDDEVCSLARRVMPSRRGELEITSLNSLYLERGQLCVQLLGRGTAWLDTGTPDSLMEAATFVQIIEKRQGQKIACLEEIALRMGYVDKTVLSGMDAALVSEYYEYVRHLASSSAPKE